MTDLNRLGKLVIMALLGFSLALFLHMPVGSQTTTSLIKEAQEYYQAGQFESSLQLLEQVSAQFTTEQKTLQNAQLQSFISLAHQQLENWPEAQDALDYGVDLLDNQPDNQQTQQILGQLKNAQGHLYFHQDRNELALDAWQTAQQIYASTGDLLGEKATLVSVSQALLHLGFYKRSCDTILDAWDRPEYFCEALEAEKIPDFLAVSEIDQPNLWQVKALHSMANSYLFLGKLDQARAVMGSVQKLKSRLDLDFPLLDNQITLTLGNIQKAIALQAQEFNEAKKFTAAGQRALDFYSQVKELPDQRSQVQVTDAQLSQLDIFIITGNYPAAQEIIRAIEANLQLLPNSKHTAYDRLRFNQSLTVLLDNQVAIAYSEDDIAQIYLDVAQQTEELAGFRLESYAFGYLGELVYEKNLELERSPQQYLEQALHLAQSNRATEIAYRWQWKLGRIYRDRGEIDRAINAYEAAFISLQDIRSDLIALEKEVQFSFREQVEPVYRELAALLLIEQSPEKVADPDNLNLARDVIEGLQLAELDNFFKDACIVFEKQEIAAIDDTAAVIYTIVLTDENQAQNNIETILALPGENLRHYETIVPYGDFEATTHQLSQYLLEPDRFYDVQNLSNQINNWLIEPLEADINPEIKTLVFVLDGILRNIPMAVLYNGTDYLIDRYAIAVTPGLQLLNPKPSITESAALVGGVSEKLSGFPALTNVPRELNMVENAFDSKKLLNDDFQTATLTQDINSQLYSVIHLATHGQFSSNPRETFIRLWDAPLGIKKFSLLIQNREVDTKKLIDLLVLSACETSRGDDFATLGLAGMAVRTGVSSTLASLWQISDRSTPFLMGKFYEYWQSTPEISKAEALRLAQIDLRSQTQNDWDVPFYWAAYTLVGKWQ
ncbi:MAG: CHAT domain-containing protein [Cyanobacteria bacterium P01_F01_bin.143]